MIKNINYIIVIILIFLYLTFKYYYTKLNTISILFLIIAILIIPNNQISILLFLIIGLTIIENNKINYTETFISDNKKENNNDLDFIIDNNDLKEMNENDKRDDKRDDKRYDKINDKIEDKGNNIKSNKIKDLTPYKIDTDLNQKLDMLNQSLQIFKQKINS